MPKKLILIIAAVIVIAALVFAYMSQRGTVSVELNSLSPITEDVSVYIASRKFPKPFTPPFTQKLRPGTYQLVAIAPGASEIREEFVVKNKQTTTLSLTLTANPYTASELELTPSSDELKNDPLLKLFPHDDANFTAKATFARDSDNKIYVTKVTITPYLPIAAGQPYDRAEVIKAKDAIVAEARAWLKANNIPDSTPVIIDAII